MSWARWGYLAAALDPLGRLAPVLHPELDPADPARAVYGGPIGVEFMHLPDPARVRWVAARMEAPPPPVDRARVLDLIARAEIFEQAMHRRYVGTKRFSLEGAAALIPLLDEILRASRPQQAVLGMSHRGRLNVMAHIAGVPPAAIFAGFEDVDPRSALGGGDLKYHLGATGVHDGVEVHLASNPSHLEAIDPVVLGRARAKQDRLGGREKVLPLLLHGDGAFAGQGITAETLNLADLAGYSVGGTIHVVVNNLIAFTAEPAALHSGRFATDVARRLPIPIFHVNGEAPDAVVRVGRIAAEWRASFGTDVVIDLIGYRRHGHSEVDDPSTTQPVVSRAIASRPPLWRIYGGGAPPDVDAIRREYEAALDEAAKARARPAFHELPPYWAPYVGGRHEPSLEVDTAVPAARLREVAERLASVPPGFRAHPKVRKLLDERRALASVDWAAAEALALGSLALDGVRVRLTGQDTGRGTFNQRHAVLRDAENGAVHVPLAGLGPVEIVDSPLSEAACVGFEYGYSRDFPEALVAWEAQFGDFVNGAQAIVDQFVAAGEDKWGLLSGLALLLPHGFEGQGPEHSSARLERFLQLAAEHNMTVAAPTTAAQIFHLLRRQALRRWRKPLVVMTPKGTLRHPLTASRVEELAAGRFRPVLADGAHERAVLCAGRVAHDLRAERERRGAAVSIVRLEQLYPFPEEELAAALEPAREIVWVQEEPGNMGAMAYALPRLDAVARGRPVRTVKRSPSASPATGSAKAHAMEQAALVAAAFQAATERDRR